MKRKYLHFLVLSIFITIFVLVIPQKTFAASPYRGGEWVTQLLGGVFDQTAAFASCPSGNKAIGSTTCKNSRPECVGGPTYTISWSQPDKNESGTLSSDNIIGGNGDKTSCWPFLKPGESGDQRPRFTFEWSSLPIGSPQGEPVTVNIKVDDPNFKITNWSLRTSTSDNQTCSPQTGGAFPTASNEQTLQIKVIKNGDCKWNHLGFHRTDSGGSGGSSSGSKLYIDPNPADPGSKVSVTATASRSCSADLNQKLGDGLLNCTMIDGLTCDKPHGISGDTNPCWWKWQCNAGTAGSYKASFDIKNPPSANACLVEKAYQIGALSAAVSPSPNPTSTIASLKTSSYRYSFSPFKINDPATGNLAWKPYTEDKIVIPHQIQNAVPGQSITVWVQFKAENMQTSSVFQKTIKYIGGPIEISNARCEYDPSGTSTIVTIEGENFGSQGRGKIKFNNQDAEVLSWSDDFSSSSPTPSPSATVTPSKTPTPSPTSSVLAASTSKSKIVAKIRGKLADGQSIPIDLITEDKGTIPATCMINMTTLNFAAKTQCFPSSNLGQKNVKLQIFEKSEGAKPLANESKLTLNKDGRPAWQQAPKLEVNKIYNLIIQAPKTTGVKKEFTALDGTTNLEDIILPVGDISPLNSPDNVINSNDYGQMKKDWIIASSPTAERVSDLNGDNRVNSIDYSCMVKNFNKPGDNFLKVQ